MKQVFPPALLLVLAFAAGLYFLPRSGKRAIGTTTLSTKPDAPAEAFREWAEWEFNLTKDPAIGRIPQGIYAAELAQARATMKMHDGVASGNAKTTGPATWVPKGPTNLGGRTRALGISVANNSIMLAGGVSGGIWRSINAGASWANVSPVGVITSISCIAQDPRAGQTSTWYYGTGEASGNSASANGAFYAGNGIYKSTDNGLTWTKLPASNIGADESYDQRMDICSRIVVNPINGDVYAAATDAIYRSLDGGVSWGQVLGSTTTSWNSIQWTDIVVTSTGRLYAALSGNASGNLLDGVWTSATGAAGSWTRISGNGSPAGWNTHTNYGRVVLALAPNQQDTLYALYDNKYVNNCSNAQQPEADLFRYSQSAGAWTDLSANLPNEAGCLSGNDPFAVQGGYDLCIAVKPDNANTVFVGGTNAYRSTNGFTSTAGTTRIGGYLSAATYAQYANHHPDIHGFVFASGSANLMYCIDDGGIQRADITLPSVVWTELNTGYQTFQYYHVAIDPTVGSGLVMGGTQDNGTTYTLTGQTDAVEYLGGDGVSVGMDAGGVTFYLGFQLGPAYRDAPSFTQIDPATSKSLFVTNFHLDPDNTNYIYYANGNDLYRNGNAPLATQTNWTLLTGLSAAFPTGTNNVNKIYAIATSRGTYSANTAQPATLSRLYAGTNTAQIFRIDDPQNVAASAAPANITPTGASGTCVNIAVHPNDSRIILAVYSNYGVNSAWYTTNANAATPTWSNVEGNIPLLSFRSCAILSDGLQTSYLVGTSKGLYGAASLAGSSTVWMQEGPSVIGYAPVADLAYRVADQTVLVGSHGNGMFITGAYPLPIRFVDFTARSAGGSDVSLSWTTGHEKQGTSYTVQRSADGITYENASEIAGASGGRLGQSSYSTSDRAPQGASKMHYRIRATENTGQVYYTPTEIVRFGVAGSSVAIQVYPTVFTGVVQVRVPADGYAAMLTDARGIRLGAIPLNLGYNTANLSYLPAGAYFLSVQRRGDPPYVQRIVKR